MSTVSIVVPVFNEEANLKNLFAELEDLNQKCLANGVRIRPFFSDNFSQDDSWKLIVDYCSTNPDAQAIRLSRNYGYQVSLLNAFRLIDSDALCILQSDLQDPPEILFEMIVDWKKGFRSIAGIIESRGESGFDQNLRKIFYRLINLVSDKKHPAGIQDFYLIDKSIYREISRNPLDFQFIRSSISSNFSFEKTIPYQRRPRILGNSKFNFGAKYSLALDGVLANTEKFRRKVAFFIASLCFVTIFSIAGITTAFLLGWRSPVAGWVSMVLIQLFVLMCLSVFGLISLEMTSRTYQLMSRPTNVEIQTKLNL
jgi:dolichol-phosphate mannosyltransferase